MSPPLDPAFFILSGLVTIICLSIIAVIIKRFVRHNLIEMSGILEISIALLVIWCLIGAAVSRLLVGLWSEDMTAIDLLFVYSFFSNLIFVFALGLFGLSHVLNKYMKVE